MRRIILIALLAGLCANLHAQDANIRELLGELEDAAKSGDYSTSASAKGLALEMKELTECFLPAAGQLNNVTTVHAISRTINLVDIATRNSIHEALRRNEIELLSEAEWETELLAITESFLACYLNRRIAEELPSLKLD